MLPLKFYLSSDTCYHINPIQSTFIILQCPPNYQEVNIHFLMIWTQNQALIYLINSSIAMCIYLFGAKKADRLTVVIESMQGLLKKCCECTFYIKVFSTLFLYGIFLHYSSS